MDLINFESEENIVRIIDFYEQKNASNNFSVNSFTNLAFIYWAVANGEIITSNDLSLLGYNKFNDIINQGLSKYPKSRELHFWEKYFPFRFSGEDFSFEECCKIIDIYKDENEENNLIPFFYLNFFDEKKYSSEIEMLKEEFLKNKTLKNKYVLSFI